MVERFYPIGTPGQPWTDAERAEWKTGTKLQRSYKEDVVEKVEALKAKGFQVEQYGALKHDEARYPLLAVKTPQWNSSNPYMLVTGGVHGYETSGVQGAIEFLDTKALEYADKVNILVAPCVSPWAYEHIQRWQADCLDPNRSFCSGKETEESRALMAYLKTLGENVPWKIHLDLHETTDTDNTEFMPAKFAEAGLPYEEHHIPDGFYLVGDSSTPNQLDFLKAVIENVKKVTHIAPADDDGKLIGETLASEGVILVPADQLALCMSVTGGTFVATTEVYPDSPRATDVICNHAQVASLTGALDYFLSTVAK